MPGLIADADREFLTLRCYAEHVGWHEGVPSVWMPTTDVPGLADALAEHHFILGWSISYNEGQTMINAMRAQPLATSGKLTGHQKQLHGRARAVSWNGTVGLQWVVHTEALAITDPQQHYDHVGLSWSDGQDEFAALDLGYEMEKKPGSWNPTPLVGD